ncbi:MAG: type II secretion system F family protein [Candidatus Pacebacteria bacterium]|nr:type II secretion system F family protein [Candidatus Paceibacterota bacterium]
MTLFSFKAIRKDGESYEGTMEASTKNVIHEKISKDGDTIIYVREMAKRPSLSFRSFESFFMKVKMSDKIVFARNLASMVEAGLSLSRALSVLERQTKNKQMEKILQSLIESINKGEPLSEAMKHFPSIFPALFVSMVRAGEESGNLVESLRGVASQLEKTYTLTRRIQGAMIYPAIILALMFVIAILMLVYVVPTLAKTFLELGVELPLSTRILISASNFLSQNFIFVVLGFVATVSGFMFVARTKKGKRTIDFALLRLPLVSPIVKEVNSARTTRTLSSLLLAGVDLIIAIRITGEVLQNSFYKDVLKQMEIRVEKGESISSVISEHVDLYPVFVSEMTNVGEETGKLSEMLMGVATFYENEVEQQTRDLSTIVEPVLMIIIGIAVGFFVLSMIGPTYSLVDIL